MRDDNHQHYHIVVSLSETPMFIDLRWKPTRDGAEQLVGRYRLRLPELLAGDFVRFEREKQPGDGVRLRFFRDSAGSVLIQSRKDRPRLKIGQVKL
jgi:hypothetical protein